MTNLRNWRRKERFLAFLEKNLAFQAPTHQEVVILTLAAGAVRRTFGDCPLLTNGPAPIKLEGL